MLLALQSVYSISLISCLIVDFECLCKVLPFCLLVLSNCDMLIVETVIHTHVDEGIWFCLSCCLYWVLLAFPLQANAV